MAKTRADRLRNDDRILRAAAEVLAQDSSATLQSVADAAGVSRLTVYRRYPDRDALVTALRMQAAAELDTALDGLPSPAQGVTAVERLLHSLIRVAARYPVALLRFAPVPGATPDADTRVVELLRAGQHAGVLRDDVTPEMLNALVFGVLSAIPAVGRPSAPLQPHHAAGPAAGPADDVARTISSLLLPGMIPPRKARP